MSVLLALIWSLLLASLQRLKASERHVLDGPEEESSLLQKLTRARIESESLNMAGHASLKGAATTNSTVGGAPYCIAIYYTSFCVNSVGFFKEQLAPILKDHAFNTELAFVPYGYMLDEGKSGRECQHGKAECYSNSLHRCALDILGELSTSQSKRCDAAAVEVPFGSFQRPDSPFVKFLMCHMRKMKKYKKNNYGLHPPKAACTEIAQRCFRKRFRKQPTVAAMWKPVRSCARAAYKAKADDEVYKLAGEATQAGAAEWLPMIRWRCPAEAGNLTNSTRLPKERAEGVQAEYDFKSWIGQDCDLRQN